MEKANVLVIGNSGVGKSTLINAVLGEEVAKTSTGTSGTTNKLEIYENDQIPFRIIDTIGFEPSYFKARKAIKAVEDWTKKSVKNNEADKKINAIWFCVDGTAGKLFDTTIKNMLKATKIWKSVPKIVVITKSYSEPERKGNKELVKKAFAEAKLNMPKKIIPVVAQDYPLDEEMKCVAAVCGIDELISATNELLPEGIKIGDKVFRAYVLKRKKAFAQAAVAAYTATGFGIGALHVPIADSVALNTLETAEIKHLGKIFGIKNDDNFESLCKYMVETGGVSVAAKSLLNFLKGIPGLKPVSLPINAVVAACFVSAVGTVCIKVYGEISTGQRDISDLDWVGKVTETEFSQSMMKKFETIIRKLNNNPKSDVKKLIKSVLIEREND